MDLLFTRKFVAEIEDIPKLKFGFRYLMNVINHRDPELKIVNECKCCYTVGDSINGQSMLLSDILNEENGWLKDGKLSIEYGINVESIQGNDRRWKFNFRERIFDTGQEDYLHRMYCYNSRNKNQFLEFCEELIYFSSPNFEQHMGEIGPGTVDFYLLETCLQIANGVQLELFGTKSKEMIPLAYSLNLPNVIRYCEPQLIGHYCVSEYSSYISEEIIFANEYKLYYYLNYLLKSVTSSENLAIILHKVDFQKMSSETMKSCTKYFFDKKKEKSLKKMKQILRELDFYDLTSEAMKCIIAKLVYDEF